MRGEEEQPANPQEFEEIPNKGYNGRVKFSGRQEFTSMPSFDSTFGKNSARKAELCRAQ